MHGYTYIFVHYFPVIIFKEHILPFCLNFAVQTLHCQDQLLLWMQLSILQLHTVPLNV